MLLVLPITLPEEVITLIQFYCNIFNVEIVRY